MIYTGEDIKAAVTDFPIHEIIKRRWSPRAFADRPVARERIFSLLEAARWAPSAYNEQPWRFIVATPDDPEAFERMLEPMGQFNRDWAHKAPLLIMTLAAKTFAKNGKPNELRLHDVGLAAASLTFQAESMGLAVHQMSGFDAGTAREVMAIPEEYEPVTIIAVGYPGEVEKLPENMRTGEMAPRSRRPLSDTIHFGAWGVQGDPGDPERIF